MDKPRLRAYLCCGPNCGPKGAGALLDYLTEEVARAGLADQVSVSATGCQAHCESGPTMVVFPGPTYYQGIDSERLARIVREHFVGGEAVREYFWNGVRRRIIPGKAPGKPLPMPVQATVKSPERIMQSGKPRRSPPAVDDFKW